MLRIPWPARPPPYGGVWPVPRYRRGLCHCYSLFAVSACPFRGRGVIGMLRTPWPARPPPYGGVRPVPRCRRGLCRCYSFSAVSACTFHGQGVIGMLRTPWPARPPPYGGVRPVPRCRGTLCHCDRLSTGSVVWDKRTDARLVPWSDAWSRCPALCHGLARRPPGPGACGSRRRRPLSLCLLLCRVKRHAAGRPGGRR